MNSQKRPAKKEQSDIKDYYAVNIKLLWRDFRKEHISLWALCLYFLFEYIRPQSIYPVLDVLPFAQILFFMALVTLFFDRSVRWVGSIENKLIILFSSIVILSIVFAFKPSVAWERVDTIINWVLLYFLIINIINSEKRLIIFLLFYFLFNLKMSQHGFISMASRGFSFRDYGLVGSGSWFRNSGEFAIQMLIFGSLSTFFVFALKGYWKGYKKWFFYMVPITAWVSVLGASSRGAQLGLAAIGIWWLLRLKGGFKALIIMALVLVALFYLIPEEQLQRFHEMGEDKTSLQRLAYWDYGIKVIREHPLLGIGYHNWREYLEFSVPEGLGPQGLIQESHNIYIQVGADTGIAGLFCFLFMVLYLFIINARTRTLAGKLDNKLMLYLAYGLDAGLIGYLVAGFFVTVFFYPFFWVQMAMIVAVNAIAKRQLIAIEKPIKSCVV